MYWTCSCGTKNPENARTCGKCNKKSEASKKYYGATILGSVVVFILVYVVGTSIGGTLVAFSLEPDNATIFSTAKELGSTAKKFENVNSEDQKAAKETAIAKARDEMSVAVHSVLFWFFPLLIFPIIGAIVGFVSQGRTVLEAAIGSCIGQVLGFAGMRFMYGMNIHPMELLIGMIVGFGIVAAGAYAGEAIQEKRERTSLEEDEALEASF